eukprot:Rmarinus@m.22917
MTSYSTPPLSRKTTEKPLLSSVLWSSLVPPTETCVVVPALVVVVAHPAGAITGRMISGNSSLNPGEASTRTVAEVAIATITTAATTIATDVTSVSSNNGRTTFTISKRPCPSSSRLEAPASNNWSPCLPPWINPSYIQWRTIS